MQITNDELLRIMQDTQDRAYMAAATEYGGKRRRSGIGNAVIWILCLSLGFATLVGILLNVAGHLGMPVPGVPGGVIDALAGKPQVQLGTPNTPAKPPERPAPAAGANESGVAPWPTLTPTAARPTAEPAGQPTLTIPPAPTATESFWTPEEQTQIAATATAFIEIIPTAPPEFVGYVDERCKDPEVVAQSKLLQLFCRKDGGE